MTRPLLLDLYCKAGGAAKGYHDAGFDVVGVDIEPQPHYPFPFILGDVLDILPRMMGDEKFLASDGRWYGLSDFDAIHASPPCQAYSSMQHIHNNRDKHPDLISQTRVLLQKNGKPWVIENVEGAPLRVDLMLCGTMFGLPLARHRIFESSIPMPLLMPSCNHGNLYDPYHGGEMARDERDKLSKAMGIDWFMTRPEVRNAIPPVYTNCIGKQFLKVVTP